MKVLRLFFSFAFIILLSCKAKINQNNSDVRIDTDFGTMYIRLYDDTPLHKSNFLSLSKFNLFNGLIFHRIIPFFMIQCKDPSFRISKDPKTSIHNIPDTTIPLEILPHHFHIRGAIGAARHDDSANPFRRSSFSQFYIVTGRVYTDSELYKIEYYINQQMYQNIYFQCFENEKNRLLQSGINPEPFEVSQIASDSAISKIRTLKKFRFTAQQRAVYKTIGGSPHLDNSYTLFGELISGIEVADKVSLLKRDKKDKTTQ